MGVASVALEWARPKPLLKEEKDEPLSKAEEKAVSAFMCNLLKAQGSARITALSGPSAAHDGYLAGCLRAESRQRTRQVCQG